MRPGVAAETWLAFTLEAPPVAPPSAPLEPGAFGSGVPSRLSLAAGLKVESLPGPGEQPQTFETVEPLADARPVWNAMRPWLGEARAPQDGDTAVYVAGVDHSFKRGDALLFLGRPHAAAPAWEFRLIDAVAVDVEAQHTVLRFERALGADMPGRLTERVAYAFRQRASLFGHNAPEWTIMHESFRSSYLARMGGGSDKGAWPAFEAGAVSGTNTGSIDLDTVYSQVTPHSYVVLAYGVLDGASSQDSRIALFTVSSIAETSRVDFGLSGRVTRLVLQGEHIAEFQVRVRETSVFALSERLHLAPYPELNAVAGDRIPVLGRVPADSSRDGA